MMGFKKFFYSLIGEEVIEDYRSGWNSDLSKATQTIYKNPTRKEINSIISKYKENHNIKYGLPPIRGIYDMKSGDVIVWTEEMVMHTEMRRKFKMSYENNLDFYLNHLNFVYLQDPQKVSKKERVEFENTNWFKSLDLSFTK